MFVSTNYICFASKEEQLCSLIVPLREVGHAPAGGAIIGLFT